MINEQEFNKIRSQYIGMRIVDMEIINKDFPQVVDQATTSYDNTTFCVLSFENAKGDIKKLSFGGPDVSVDSLFQFAIYDDKGTKKIILDDELRSELRDLYDSLIWSFNKPKIVDLQGRTKNIRDIPKKEDIINELDNFIKNNFSDKDYVVEDLLEMARDEFEETNSESINLKTKNNFDKNYISKAIDLSDELAKEYCERYEEYITNNLYNN